MKNKIVIILIGAVLLITVLFTVLKKKANQADLKSNGMPSNGSSTDVEPVETVSKSDDLDVLEKELEETVILEEDFSDL